MSSYFAGMSRSGLFRLVSGVVVVVLGLVVLVANYLNVGYFADLGDAARRVGDDGLAGSLLSFGSGTVLVAIGAVHAGKALLDAAVGKGVGGSVSTLGSSELSRPARSGNVAWVVGGVVLIGWVSALLNQFRGAGGVGTGGVTLLPQGVFALVILAVVCVLAGAGYALASRIRPGSGRWEAVLPGSVLLVGGAVACGYLATTSFAIPIEQDYALRLTGPAVLLAPTAVRSLLSAGVVMLIASATPFPRTRLVLLGIAGLLIATLVTPYGFTAWLPSAPLGLLVAALIAHLTRSVSKPEPAPRTTATSSGSTAG